MAVKIPHTQQRENFVSYRFEWRVLLFSTGEYSLNSYMKASGEKWEAGQAVRLPSIPVATQYDIYKNLHDFDNGADLSEHLQAATAEQYGTAGREWINNLLICHASAFRQHKQPLCNPYPH
ncbi:hypothetical protein QG052_00450 [Kingella kingae]|uniref:hypothetical protein n=1 Tax=Kingella kingae TaxID=504 RepID=UPI00254A01FE|nr:hypothetical protein [Kingella kingae]MDK4575750.1 hypothetical protein [Kingella kingae]MDK4581734.1 hypothetical protein [Kingella kingae]MDK4591990.1 hypothetical protein [Kingella kingae]MDK4593815.1 hypothetical protein [Kingella kingae]MDK4643493.1 hypothetical protein [Kingella kingae]